MTAVLRIHAGLYGSDLWRAAGSTTAPRSPVPAVPCVGGATNLAQQQRIGLAGAAGLLVYADGINSAIRSKLAKIAS